MRRLLLCLLLAACAAEPDDADPADLPLVPDDELELDYREAAPDALETPLAFADPVRRVCIYEGKDATGRASCWYPSATVNTCRTLNEIWRDADHCAPAGCLRNNTASSLYANPANHQLQIYLYKADHLMGARYIISTIVPKTFNIPGDFNDDISSAIICHWE